MDVLSSRILLRPSDLDRSRRFYRDVLGLAVYREFGPPDDPGVVFFLGPGLLEVSGYAAGSPGPSVMIWLQVRDVSTEHERYPPRRFHHQPLERLRGHAVCPGHGGRRYTLRLVRLPFLQPLPGRRCGRPGGLIHEQARHLDG